MYSIVATVNTVLYILKLPRIDVKSYYKEKKLQLCMVTNINQTYWLIISQYIQILNHYAVFVLSIQHNDSVYIHILNHYAVYLKQIQRFMSITPQLKKRKTMRTSFLSDRQRIIQILNLIKLETKFKPSCSRLTLQYTSSFIPVSSFFRLRQFCFIFMST